MCKAIVREKYFSLAVLAVLAALYFFGMREPFSVSRCHTLAENTARQRLLERVKADPDNKTLLQAARANLYANEDYQPTMRRCLLQKGYR